MKQVFDEEGYTSFIATSNCSLEQEEASLQSFLDHRVDGLAVATRGTAIGNKVLRRIAQQNVPLVTIGRARHFPGVDSVTADHFQGAFDAVIHLIALDINASAFLASLRTPADRRGGTKAIWLR